MPCIIYKSFHIKIVKNISARCQTCHMSHWMILIRIPVIWKSIAWALVFCQISCDTHSTLNTTFTQKKNLKLKEVFTLPCAITSPHPLLAFSLSAKLQCHKCNYGSLLSQYACINAIEGNFTTQNKTSNTTQANQCNSMQLTKLNNAMQFEATLVTGFNIIIHQSVPGHTLPTRCGDILDVEKF